MTPRVQSKGSVVEPMTPSDEYFLKQLHHLSELFRTELTDGTLRAYLFELKGLAILIEPSRMFTEAKAHEFVLNTWGEIFQRCIRECRFFPTVADIYERIPKAARKPEVVL